MKPKHLQRPPVAGCRAATELKCRLTVFSIFLPLLLLLLLVMQWRETMLPCQQWNSAPSVQTLKSAARGVWTRRARPPKSNKRKPSFQGAIYVQRQSEDDITVDWLIDWMIFDQVREASFCSELHTFINIYLKQKSSLCKVTFLAWNQLLKKQNKRWRCQSMDILGESVWCLPSVQQFSPEAAVMWPASSSHGKEADKFRRPLDAFKDPAVVTAVTWPTINLVGRWTSVDGRAAYQSFYSVSHNC